MTRLKLKYVDSYTDTTGKQRFYFRRRRGALRVALPGLPGSEAFMAAYQKALETGTPVTLQIRGAPGTIAALVQQYLESPNFLGLKAPSQAAYRRVLDRWVREDGIAHRLISQMKRAHIEKMMAQRAATPGSSNDLLKKISILTKFAIAHGWRHDDPTVGIRKFQSGPGHHTWTEGQIEQFEQRWPPGSKERLAFGLLLFTGQRRSDVVRMSWRDIESDAIRVAQQKSNEKSKLWIPLHPALKEQLDAWPKDHVVILATEYGKPFTAGGFGNWMADKIDGAALPEECVTHGLRKAAARRLAEAGCTTLQIMAITGHRSLQEVERYTREAEQKRLAREAMRQLRDRSRTKIP